MNEQEIWRPIVGYEGLYEVSSIGRVKSLARICKDGHERKEKILKPSPMVKGYMLVNLCKHSTSIKSFLVHRLIAGAFFGKSPLAIDHLNGNKTDNRIENLEYVTNRENSVRYFKKKSLLKTGVRHAGTGKFKSSIYFNKQRLYLGIYKTEDEAYQAYLNFRATHNT
jgi:hypothetical protein